MPAIDLSAANFESTVSSNSSAFGKVDNQAEHTLGAAAQSTSIPTLKAFKGGTPARSQPGALPAAAFEELTPVCEQQRSA